MGRLEVVCAATADDALTYLARRPYENVYVHWLLAGRSISRNGDLTLWRDDEGAVRGTCYYGAPIVPAADTNGAIDAFAEHARRVRSARMIVGPRPTVERFWHKARAVLPAPAAIRTSQPLYAVARDMLRYTRADATVGPATIRELDEIVPNSAMMIAGELGGDPRRSSADFRLRTSRIIKSGWWWRSRVGGKLAFMCNIGSQMPQTAQLQGVWTPPAMRGRGHATRALGAICDILLDTWPTLCLYVNGFNAPAIALYERVGFRRAGEFQTILLR